MPLYEYRCVDPECRQVSEYMRPSAKRNEPAICKVCGKAARRIISTPQPWKGVWAEPVHPEKLRTTKEIWE